MGRSETTTLATATGESVRQVGAAAPDTIPAVFLGQALARGDGAYLHFFKGGAWRTLSWAETAECVMRVACGLVRSGLKPGQHVALMSPNRPEWLYCDLGIMAAGAVTVPIYPTVSARVAGYIAEDSNARLAIVADATLGSKLQEGGFSGQILSMNDAIAHWVETEPEAELRRDVTARIAKIEPNDVATVIYTSGTSGDQKGVILTHTHFTEMARGALAMFSIRPDDVILSYLPYSHVMERVDGIFIETVAGASIWQARGIDTLLEDIQVARPTIMLGVPRVFEKVHAAVQNKVRTEPVYKRALFSWALGVGAARLRDAPGPWLRLRAEIADRLVLGPLARRLTGGRLRFFISGGAPLNEKVEEFFWSIGVKILQGWGLTEATSGVTSNTEEKHRYRTVGIPIPGTLIRIADDGEILVQGPGVMAGYLNKPDATLETIVDGWLKTGDMGFVDQDGYLTITDRKKDLIKTAGGKYVAPLPIESQLQKDRYVKDSLVVGDQRPYVVALIVPDWAPLVADTGLHDSPGNLVDDAGVRAHFAAVVDAVNQGLASFETVKYFALLPRDFTEAADELTPSLKKKRRVITRHFEHVIENLYSAHNGAVRHD